MTVRFNEKGKYFTEVVSKDAFPSIIQTLAHRVHGNIHVRSGQRLKDELNQPEQFLAVTGAKVYGLDGDLLYESDFLAINRDRIVWVIPDAEIHADDSPEDSA